MRTNRVRLLALPLALLPVSACGWFEDSSDGGSTRGSQLYVEQVEVNGREVSCVVYDSNRDAGAVDCDWGTESPSAQGGTPGSPHDSATSGGEPGT